MFNVIDQYNSFVENNFIKKNVDQIKFLKQANNVWSSYSKTKLFFKDKIFIKFVLSKYQNWKKNSF